MALSKKLHYNNRGGWSWTKNSRKQPKLNIGPDKPITFVYENTRWMELNKTEHCIQYPYKATLKRKLKIKMVYLVLDARIKYHRLVAETTEICLSQFWRLEVWDQCASMIRYWCSSLPGLQMATFLYVLIWLFLGLCLWKIKEKSLCLFLLMSPPVLLD